VIKKICEKMGKPERIKAHLAAYGHGIEDRLTGHHETASYKEFFYGVSHRGQYGKTPRLSQDHGGLPAPNPGELRLRLGRD
jgi:glutamine synthetase